MSHRRSLSIALPAVLAILAAACSTPSSVAPLTVPLKYKMMASPAEFSTLPPCAALGATRVVDAREDKTLGKRFVEGKSNPPAVVTTSSDVAAWVAAALDNAMKREGIATSGSSKLTVTVEQITTSENVLHRSGYEGRVVLSAELHSAQGQSCWKGRSEGFAENYGYAGSAENYQETLNHAADRAMIKLFATPELRKAICSCGGS